MGLRPTRGGEEAEESPRAFLLAFGPLNVAAALDMGGPEPNPFGGVTGQLARSPQCGAVPRGLLKVFPRKGLLCQGLWEMCQGMMSGFLAAGLQGALKMLMRTSGTPSREGEAVCQPSLLSESSCVSIFVTQMQN